MDQCEEDHMPEMLTFTPFNALVADADSEAVKMACRYNHFLRVICYMVQCVYQLRACLIKFVVDKCKEFCFVENTRPLRPVYVQ